MDGSGWGEGPRLSKLKTREGGMGDGEGRRSIGEESGVSVSSDSMLERSKASAALASLCRKGQMEGRGQLGPPGQRFCL